MPTKLSLSLLLALFALSLALPASAQTGTTATPTVTYTPMPTRTATPVVSNTTVLPDGTGALYTNSWTAGERGVFDAVLALAALYMLRFLYDLAKQWNR
jgi:P pilus assembly chaperone PapD